MLQLLWGGRPRAPLPECTWTRCLQIRSQALAPPVGRRRFWTKDEDAITLQRRKEGADFSSIAKELGRTANAVQIRYNCLLGPSPQLDHSGRGFSRREDDVIIQRKCEGAALGTIAKELCCTARKVGDRWQVLRYRCDVPEAALTRESRPRSKLSVLERLEAEALIKQRYREGKTFEAIAKELQCGTAALRRWFRGMRLTKDQLTGFERKAISDQEMQSILRRRSEGWTVQAIASELGRTASSVQRHLRRQQITTKLPRAFTRDEDQEILKLREDGKTHREIGAVLGRAQGVISKRLKLLRDPPPDVPSRWTLEEVDELVTQYDRGVAIYDIACALGRDANLVRPKLQSTLVKRGRTDWSPVNLVRGTRQYNVSSFPAPA